MKINYRPEIDGLRAVAVIAVIFYHAQINILGYQPFKGGFIGVDIFFVISGYLITSIILKELVTTGTFSFLNFYQRRIRRIIPALLFVMLAALPFAWIYLLPSSFIDFSKSIIYSLGFSSNFYFHYSGLEYGAVDSLLKPFLHTWTLSVEEQYYIVFPVILLLTFKYFRKHLLTILVIGFLISLLITYWGSKNYPSATFYFLHTRMWELIAGSLLAYFEINLGARSNNKILNQILPVLGLFLIGHSIIFFNDKMLHFSFYTLSPIIGVCLIIWFSNKDEFITKILSSKLFVGTGLISYSLYLWHYPIFAFARIKGDTFSQYDKFEWICLTIVLSIISYFLVERPFRNKKFNFKKISFFLLTIGSVILIFNLLVFKYNGFIERLPKYLHYIVLNSEDDLRKPKLPKNFFDEINKLNNSNMSITIFGDSHIERLNRVFNPYFNVNIDHYEWHYIGGCYFLPNSNLIDLQTNKIRENCDNKIFKEVEKKIVSKNNSVFILGGRLPLFLTGKRFDNLEGGLESEGDWHTFKSANNKSIGENLKDSLIDMAEKGIKIIIIYPIPPMGWDIPKILFHDYRESGIFSFKEKIISIDYKLYKDRAKESFKILDSISHPNIYKIFPHKIVCNTVLENRCVGNDANYIYYEDDDHPSYYYSREILKIIVEILNKF